MSNENSNSLNGSNMPTRFTSIEELYDYQNGLPDPFATVTPVMPVDNVRTSLSLDTSYLGNAFDPLMLDYDDGKEQLKDLGRDEYFLFKVFLNPDGSELIKRYQNDNPFQKYLNVDIFIYHEWTDKYDTTGTICFVRFSKQLADFIHSGSRYRSPAAVAKKIADNYNAKKDQPYHDEINPKLIEEAIIFQRDKGKLTTGIVKTVANKILAELCFFAANQARKGKYNENVWKNPKDKNYAPLLKVAELEALKKVLLKIQNNLASSAKFSGKLSKQVRKAGKEKSAVKEEFEKAAALIDLLTEVIQSFETSIGQLVRLEELGQQAAAIINAVICGAIDALIEMVAGCIELIGIVFSLDDKANKQLVFESFENAIQRFRQRPFIDFINEQIDEITDRYNSRELSSTEIAYNAGEDMVELAMLVSIVRDVIVLIRKIPQLAEFTKTAEKVVKKDLAKAAETSSKGIDDILKKLYPKEPSKVRRIKDDFDIDLFQKKVDEPIQVWYKDIKIYEGDEAALKKWLDDLDDKNTANRKKFLEEELKSSTRKQAYEEFTKAVSKQNLDDLTEHIFEGHFGRFKKKFFSTKGIHSVEELKSGNIKIIEGSKRPPNPKPDEIFEAKVQKKYKNGEWVDKLDNDGYSTFFPESWSKERIMEEIAFAWKNKVVPDTKFPNVYRGTSTNGKTIEFIIVNSEIKTVYPIK